MRLILPDEQATAALATAMAPFLQADDWLLLEGAMGAGKTTFTRSLVAALQGDADSVSSPSYALMNAYQARLPVWHVDAWRLQGDEDFEALGLDDFALGGIVIVEWPSRIPALAQQPAWRMSLQATGNDERSVVLTVPRPAAATALATQLSNSRFGPIREDASGE